MTEIKKQDDLLATQSEVPMGFEDEEEGDLIVPRIKIIQSLSPERKDKIADEGDIINSLTKEKLNGEIFVPVFKFNNNIWWKPRTEGGGIQCIARDGKLGVRSDGQQLACKMCRLNEFDNSKQGMEALPKCTKYINFFGFIASSRMPIILSFSKTNYNEGKKLFSLAKVTMQNMWNFGYRLENKEMSKAGNDWFNIVMSTDGITSDEDRAYGLTMYHSFRNRDDLNFDMDEGNMADAAAEAAGPSDASKEEVAGVEF